MSNQLRVNSQQRAGFRMNVKKLLTSFETLKSKPDDPENAEKLQILVEKLKYYNDKLDTLNASILAEIEKDEDLAKDVEESSELTDKILDVLHGSNTILSKLSRVASDDVSSSRGKVSVKLPKLEIEKFNGSPLRWQEFWDSFSSTIDENDDLSDVEKLQYLRRYLAGEALHMVEGYRVVGSNYATVVESLKERFGNPELATFAHFEKLLDMPSCQGDFSKLRQTYDDCERHVRSLVALGLSEETFGLVFTPIILSKLPRSVRVELHRRNESRPWKLANLRELMKEEINAREMSERFSRNCEASRTEPKEQSGWVTKKGRSQMPPPTQAQLSNNAYTRSRIARSGSDPTVECAFCGGQHYSATCGKFKTIDQRKAALKGKCFNCLKEGHSVRECKRTKPCFFCKGERHHSSLCYTKFGSSFTARGDRRSGSGTAKPDHTQTKPDAHATRGSDVNMFNHSPKIQMQMALVQIRNGKQCADVRIFFDSGSSRSYISSICMKKLGLQQCGEEIISVAKFANRKRKTTRYGRADVSVPTVDGDIIPVSALVTDIITCPIHKYPVDPSRYPVLTQVRLADPPVQQQVQVEIDILIGADHYYDFIGGNKLQLGDAASLIESKLGYIVTGKVDAPSGPPDGAVLLFRHTVDVGEVGPDIEKFWSLEDIGVKDNPCQSDDERALQQFNNSVTFDDGRYNVTWPWRETDPELPTNYGLAFGRLKSLIQRLKPDQQALKDYDQTIQNQLEAGIIEEVQPDETSSNKIHYIPHHCVIRKDATTTKLRIVYDASAKATKAQRSLNECLLRGPVILQDLCGMLLRFRLHAVAVTADIEKAFLQVGVKTTDRDVTRFLWLKQLDRPPVMQNLRTFRFCRVPFGIISSPFLLAATIKHHMHQAGTTTSNDIASNIYVDNLIAGRSSTCDAVAFYSEAKTLFDEISMNIREWYTNDDATRQQINAKDRGRSECPKVLGLRWDTSADTIACIGFEDTAVVNTKRQLLHSISKIFDPCGLVSPGVVQAKLLVQEAWKAEMSWDDELPQDICSSFNALRADLSAIGQIRIPRLAVDVERASRLEIHCFCDASAKAYAAACYLRAVYPSVDQATALIFSKVRLAPIKQVTIPRLELMAAVVGSRVLKLVNREIGKEVSKKYLWTDSKCVISWVNAKRSLPVFVQNRVEEIRSCTDVTIRYVPTACNPADLPTKGVSVAQLRESSLWWSGPQFLHIDETMWPETNDSLDDAEHLEAVSPEVALVIHTAPSSGVGLLIDNTAFSSFSRLLRVTAYLIRFINNCRKKRCCRRGGVPLATEVANAEVLWTRYIQESSFPNCLVSKTHQTIKRRLGLFSDDSGVIRCRGRIDLASLPFESRCPKLLPKNHHFTDLIIQHCHNRLFHAGARQTLTQLRLEYWIPQGLAQVKKILRKCIVCRKCESGPFRVPESPPIPSFRLSDTHAFEHVGVDYLGPLIVRNVYDKTATPSTSKVWLCLFTCATTRAIHLEVAIDSSADQFIHCLRRFVALFGCPQTIVSDNAKYFVATDKALKRIATSDTVQAETAAKGIHWKFITEMAPWMGGFYERLVGCVKRSLRKTLLKRSLTTDELRTVVAEVAAIVNSRPLVPFDADIPDHCLTPAHFLAKQGRIGLPRFSAETDQQYNAGATTGVELLQMWAKGQKLLDEFWRCWRHEYLSSLRERPPPQLNRRGSMPMVPEKGMVVLLKDDLPRCRWKMGRIIDVFDSSDGRCRSASVQLPSGKTVRRSLRCLCPVEFANTYKQSHSHQQISTTASTDTSRPKRKAALRARELISDQLAVESDGNFSDSN